MEKRKVQEAVSEWQAEKRRRVEDGEEGAEGDANDEDVQDVQVWQRRPTLFSFFTATALVSVVARVTHRRMWFARARRYRCRCVRNMASYSDSG